MLTGPNTDGLQDGGVPLPPIRLASRVSALNEQEPLTEYLRIGRAIKDDFVSLLGPSWDWRGKRVLDFGCGAGRVLRHFLAEAEAGAELYGCDIEEPGIAWVRQHLSPPVHAFVSDERPPLPFPDGHFDLIWAASVFTHLADGWSDWLLELHRLLSPEGLLIASFLGEGMSETVAGEPWEEDRIGMNVIGRGPSWTKINVLHSPWWIRAHWGRAFEVLELRPSGGSTASLAQPGTGHGLVLMRRLHVAASPAELERPEPDEREIEALRHNIRQLLNLPAAYSSETSLEIELSARRSERHDLAVTLETILSSRSWRLTRPLRAIGEAARRIRSRAARPG